MFFKHLKNLSDGVNFNLQKFNQWKYVFKTILKWLVLEVKSELQSKFKVLRKLQF